MKKLATVAALAALIASPAFAQQFSQSLESSNAVLSNDDEIIGQDPDINVRLDLQRQAEYYAHLKGD